MSATAPSIHAAAIVVGEAGVLIRGVSGSGKSSLALAVVEAASLRGLFARLVADDRVRLECAGGRLIARPHPAIAGRIERRGQGVADMGHEGAAVLRLVVDLGPALESPDAPLRMAPEGYDVATLAGVKLPRLVIPTGLGAVESARIALDFISRSRL